MEKKNFETDALYEFPYRKPDKVSKWKAFSNAIYNPKNHAFLGRTASSWGGILSFYVIYFSALAAMFSICMYGLKSTLNPEIPTYTLDSSLIGSNPGLGYRPYASDMDEKGSLIWYKASDEGNVQKWTSNLDVFLRDYNSDNREVKGLENRTSCSAQLPAPPGKVCDVPLDAFGPCTHEKGYSYNKSTPCVFIKLNRIFNWVPDFYNDTENLPEDMDSTLKDYISAQADRNYVWVNCYGEGVADRENIGTIAYYPKQGFAGYYYPFTNIQGYLSPLVAVHLQRPTTGVLINIECRAWAKNMKYERARNHRSGSVHFEIMVD